LPRSLTMMISTRKAVPLAARAYGASSIGPNRSFYMPRVTERRENEAGPGGRSSNAGVTVAVFGASGFLGRYVCANCGTNAVKTYVGNRGDEFEMRYLNTMFDLGRLRKVFTAPVIVSQWRM